MVRALACILLVAGPLGGARAAHAAGGRPAETGAIAWETSVDAGCPLRASQLAREVDLACDATGGTCRRVERGAERRAVLRCAETERWTVEARDATGARLWTIAIDGARESRARVAAMWIARSPRDAPPPDAPVIAAPPAPPRANPEAAAPPATAAAPPAAAPPPTARPTAAISTEAAARPASAPQATARDAAPRDAASMSAARPAHGGLAASIRGAASAGLLPQALGANARAAFALPMAMYAGLALGGARSVGGTSGYALTTGHAGASFGWGAPWSAGTFGAWIEAGALLGAVDRGASASPGSRQFAEPYGEIALALAPSASSALRPWIALSFTALARPVRVVDAGAEVTSLPVAMGAIDAGLAWAAW